MQTTPPQNQERAQSEASNWAARSLAGLGAILPSVYVFLVIRTNSQEPFSMWLIGFVVLPATFASLCLWFAFKGHNAVSRARMKCALIGGITVGGIAFLAGFVGPLIFTSESNQGPLLGIFVTGPIGFLVGNVLGAIYGFLGSHKQKLSSNVDTA